MITLDQLAAVAGVSFILGACAGAVGVIRLRLR